MLILFCLQSTINWSSTLYVCIYFLIIPINSDLKVSNNCGMELLTVLLLGLGGSTREILKSQTYWFLTLHYLPHERTHSMTGMCPKKAGTCEEWSQLVWEKECVCVLCLLCACVQCHVKLSVRKRRSINTLGRFRFHVQGGAVGHAIHISFTVLQHVHYFLNRITFTTTTSLWHSTPTSICSCMVRESVHIQYVWEKEKSVMFTSSDSL